MTTRTADKSPRARRAFLALSLCLPLAAMGSAHAQQGARALIVASTTSTVDSGLFNALLPQFKADSGVDVRVISQGTGQAIDTGRRGDADVVFVHARKAEEEFVASGLGVRRRPVMYNDFVIVGPRSDPANVAGSRDAGAALRAIAAAGAPFVSRGDRSGTHLAELALWAAAGLDPTTRRGAWYREIGQGMGAALNIAGGLDAYTLTDRGTWASFRNRGALTLLSEGDRALFNQYGVILVNPARHPHVRAQEGQAFIDWLTGPKGQKAIADYKIDGQRIFFPNADDPGA
jgi:tungstate transport system substrate-binding protein